LGILRGTSLPVQVAGTVHAFVG